MKKMMKTGGMSNPNSTAKASPTTGGKSVPYKKGGATDKPKAMYGKSMMKKGGSTKK